MDYLEEARDCESLWQGNCVSEAELSLRLSKTVSGFGSAVRTDKPVSRNSQDTHTTLALTADVAGKHRQSPTAPRDWHLLGCQVEAGRCRVYPHDPDVWRRLCLLSMVSRGSRRRADYSKFIWQTSRNLASTCCGRFHLEAGGQDYRAVLITFFVLCTYL